MAKDIIVKVQKALFPPGAPALIYDQKKALKRFEPFQRLPEEIRTILADASRVYWLVTVQPDGDLAWHGQAPHQEW